MKPTNCPSEVFSGRSKPDIFWGVVDYKDIAHVPVESYVSEGELVGKWPGWLASRYAMTSVVKRVRPGEVVVGHETSGKPVLLNGEGIDISLSHSGSWGAAMVSSCRARVGIDIELVREWREETLRAFLTAGEYDQVMAEAEDKRNLEATKYWTAKEAYLKAIGLGLRRHPSSVNIADVPVAWKAVDKYIVATVWLEYGRC